MFHFPWFRSIALCIQTTVSRHDSRRVSPFGNLRIKACLPLPGAYRSLPRPSSPTDAKASIVRPYALDHEIWSSRRSCLPFSMQLSKNKPACAGNCSSVDLTPSAGLPRRGSKRLGHPPGFVLRCAPNQDWWACLESNQGPCPYQGHALTN